MLPDIYFFNPTCEPAIANGSPWYTAPARLRQFESDLGYLPAWLGEEMDQVLIQGAVDQNFNEWTKVLGFNLPEILNLDQALSDEVWISQTKGRFLPWGWSPAVYQRVRNMLPSFSETFRRSVVADWKSGHKELYSRLTALELLGKMLKNHSRDWLPDQADLPVVCNSLESIRHEIDRRLSPSTLRQAQGPGQFSSSHLPIFPFPNFQISKFPKAVVKMPWSSSGRGLLLFPNPDSTRKNDEVLSGMLSQQGFVTVEPWHKKVTDLSYQFEILDGEVKYRGCTFLETDPKGRYVRNYLTEDVEIQEDVKVFMDEHHAKVVDMLTESLSQSKYSTLYEGWIGVDTIIYRNEKGMLKFYPMLEINGRFTMGAIALKIRNYLAEGSNGFLQIFYSKTGNFQAFCQKREEEKPLVMDDRKIVSGFLPLTPPSPDHHFGGYVEVTAPLPRCS